MIQIGTLRSFVTKEGEEKFYFKTIKDFNYPTLKELFNKVESDLPKYLSEAERYNIFYTVAHHLEGKRYYQSWQAQDYIPFDLDGIDLEKIDDYLPIVGAALDIDISKCGIVYTGNGIHVLVKVPRITDKNFIKDYKTAYQKLYGKIVDACTVAELPITKDTTAWDYGRILRVPFTRNEKKDPEGNTIIKHCTLKQNAFEVQDLKWPVVEKVRKDLFLASGSFPLPDKDTILKECKFFHWLQDSPDEVHEPHAYAMLSITGHFNDENKTSEILYNKFSSPSINSKNVHDFTEQALAASGPRTCTGINEIWGKCKTCPHYKKITSPVLLKSDNHIGTEHCGFSLVGMNGAKVRQYDDLVKFFRRKYMYKHVAELDEFFVYNGTHYEVFHKKRIKMFADKYFSKPVKESERIEFKCAVEAKDFTPISFLESKEEGLINLKNGVLDVKSKKLLEHSPEYNFTYCLPFDYDPEAACPTYDKYIKDVTLERPDLQNILEEFMGYVIYGGEYIFHKALILSGSGKNGKSTFIDILKMLAGKNNYSTVPLVSVNQNSFMLAQMAGKLLNISEEEPVSCFKETSTFKNLTGNNTVTAQKKFKDPFEMLSLAKIVISYNEMPFISDTTTGMRRRLLVVPFELDLEGKPHLVDTAIQKKLSGELSGIFNKALEGYFRLYKQGGFTKSKSVDEAVNDLLTASNSFLAWKEDCVIEDSESITPSKDLYNSYLDYMDQAGDRRPMASNKFFQNLKNSGFVFGRPTLDGKQQRAYYGLKIVLNNTTF